MTTAVVCIICIAMIVVGGMTLSQGVLTSADTAALSAQQLSIREGNMMRTRLTGISASLPAANTLNAVIENSGQTRLASFDKWDCIVQYYDAADNYYVNWLPYHAGALGNNQWQKTGLNFRGQPESFEPEILNHGEQMDVRAILNPAPGYRAINVTLATPNGIAPTLVCGPPAMLKFTMKPLLDLGFPPERIITSLERRMSCGIGKCGHCGVGGKHVCTDGPVFTYRQVQELLRGQF